jgi:hypothetical protein
MFASNRKRKASQIDKNIKRISAKTKNNILVSAVFLNRFNIYLFYLACHIQ